MAGSTFSRIKTWIAGQTLTASDLNAEYDNILSNLDPTGIDDESATNAAAQATKDPYAGASLIKAVSLEEELQQIRYILKQITGQSQWYIDADTVSARGSYAADAEASDTYVITLDPVPAAYYDGMVISFKANTANTGAATLNVNALGAKDIKKKRDQDLATSDIEANQVVIVVYDGTNFQMQSQVASANVSFPAGAVSSADPNTLDDYEEGTFTPTVGGNATYTTQIGKYTKIGNVVTLWIGLVINVLGTGSATTISGCPFTSGANFRSYGSVAYTTFGSNAYSLIAGNAEGTATITFHGQTALDNNINAGVVAFGNTASVYFNLCHTI